MCHVRNVPFEDQNNSFFCRLAKGFIFLKRTQNQFKMRTERKCESIGGYLTTPRSIYGREMCGAWLFVHKTLFTLQEHVKMTKTDETCSFFAKKYELVTGRTIVT